MALQRCPKCEGTGLMKSRQPVSMTEMGEKEEECDLCEGVGWVEKDLTPLIIKRLNKIIKLLEKMIGGK